MASKQDTEVRGLVKVVCVRDDLVYILGVKGFNLFNWFLLNEDEKSSHISKSAL